MLRTFIGPFDLFRDVVQGHPTVESLCVKKRLFEEAQYNCLEISKAREKNSSMKNVRFISIFDTFFPIIFLRFSEVGFSPFRDFPGLIQCNHS